MLIVVHDKVDLLTLRVINDLFQADDVLVIHLC